ncbi:MAG: GNAT family N-acetyltransferase [Selenomonadaceae bacterium]|nr:GNAT family N-acetyltransferase [Selenomonadaceae bacterium]MBR7024803.1 GNAT family N-acetyltransferase [Selenomonadaceae bacterium]MBR7025049.1 GNAT family N-acetyltransferase [Selenomonadaceae bacterium]
MKIVRAAKVDLSEILSLQYSAYQSEAELLNNYNLPPLKQTLSDLQAEFDKQIFLKAIDDAGSLVGSVRYLSEGDTVYIGKLIVNPLFQRRGIGTKLLLAVEELCPNERYELFTSNKSFKNISLYERLGYKIFAEKSVEEDLTFVYLEKINRRVSASDSTK